MDEKKTTQVLKEIFDLCGIEVLKDRKKFQSCLEDLLNSPDYNAERLVLGYALNSSALWPFTKTSALSPEQAGRAVEQLQTESRMTEEDAVFVVRCVAAARGGNPDMVSRREPEPAPSVTEVYAYSCKFTKGKTVFSLKRGMVHLISKKESRNGNVCRGMRFESYNGDSSTISLTEVKKVKTYIEFICFGLIAVFLVIYRSDVFEALWYSWIGDIVGYVGLVYILSGILGGCIVGGILYMCAYRRSLRIDTRGLGRYFIVCDSHADKKRIVEFVRTYLIIKEIKDRFTFGK